MVAPVIVSGGDVWLRTGHFYLATTTVIPKKDTKFTTRSEETSQLARVAK